MFSTEECIANVCARLCRLMYEPLQEDFKRKFRKWAPNREAIKDFVNKFKRTDSVKDKDRADRPPITCYYVR